MTSFRPFQFSFSRKLLAKIFVISSIVGMLLLSYPVAAFYAGNLFFGQVKTLYNLTFAKTLYIIATHPVDKKLTPWSAHYQLSRVYFIEGDIFASLDEVNKELALNPDNYISYYMMGLDYGYMRMPYEGIQAFDKYISFNPNTWAGRNDKAWLQFRVGDVAGALGTIEPVINYYTYTPWVQNTYCTLLLNTDQVAKAQEVCKHAKDLIDKLTPEAWGHSYPGNDPAIYTYGLEAMKASSEKNYELSQKMGK